MCSAGDKVLAFECADLLHDTEQFPPPPREITNGPFICSTSRAWLWNLKANSYFRRQSMNRTFVPRKHGHNDWFLNAWLVKHWINKVQKFTLNSKQETNMNWERCQILQLKWTQGILSMSKVIPFFKKIRFTNIHLCTRAALYAMHRLCSDLHLKVRSVTFQFADIMEGAVK